MGEGGNGNARIVRQSREVFVYARRPHARGIPKTVWALGFVSMFMDISSEMIHALLPLYMVTVLGTSVLAVGLMAWTANKYQQVFWLAVLPASVSVAVLVFCVHEPKRPAAERPRRLPLGRRDLAGLGRTYWAVVGIGLVFTLARFSEAFLLLRAEPAGLPPMWAPLVLVVMGIAYSLSAWPAGALSDRMPRTDVLLTGVALLLASVFAGALWDALGFQATFVAGALLAAAADYHRGLPPEPLE